VEFSSRILSICMSTMQDCLLSLSELHPWKRANEYAAYKVFTQHERAAALEKGKRTSSLQRCPHSMSELITHPIIHSLPSVLLTCICDSYIAQR
jgi:hypothetical protein